MIDSKDTVRGVVNGAYNAFTYDTCKNAFTKIRNTQQ